jgi:HEAT repeat protein
MKREAQRWWNQATEMVHGAANDPHVFAQWVEQLASRDPHTAVPTMWALQQAGAPVIPTLLRGLGHHHPRVRRACVDIIDHGGYGGDARCVRALLPLLHDPVPHIRRAVWHTLFCERCQDASKCELPSTGTLDRVALLIRVGIHDPNPKLQRQLIGALGAHIADPRARDALVQLVSTTADSALVVAARQALAGVEQRPGVI